MTLFGRKRVGHYWGLMALKELMYAPMVSTPSVVQKEIRYLLNSGLAQSNFSSMVPVVESEPLSLTDTCHGSPEVFSDKLK